MKNTELTTVLTQINEAASQSLITAPAAEHLKRWLTDDVYAEYVPQIVAHVEEKKWKTLDDVFWTIIPFGTGGRRGKMYPIGCNAINDRTIGESIQGLVDYVQRALPGKSLSCAVAYDTRHRSREFAELTAEILAAANLRVEFLDGYRSTPELSFAVRHKRCDCGVMVTASHNPPSDNAVKVYWSTGGQLLPPHDKGVIDCVMQVRTIHRKPFQQAVQEGLVRFCQEEVDAAFIANVAAQSLSPLRDVNIVYSPLHGVGGSAVVPALKAAGFPNVEVFAPHAEPSGDFPNVPGHVSNPENPAVFDAIIERAKETQADVILATDPDCDRLGVAAPLGKDRQGAWGTFTGNQIAVLMVDYLLEQKKAKGGVDSNGYVVKTLVTTEMIRRIADSYGVKTHGDLLVGFKWIAGLIDEKGPAQFLFGAEESHGYQVGVYTRDKDGAVASLMMAELAAVLKKKGQTLHEKLDSLFWQHGCHLENTVSVTLPGSSGMQKMIEVMTQLREQPPTALAGISVRQVRDYERGVCMQAGKTAPLTGPRGDLVILDLAAEGNYAAVRPSGTEPKIKFYLFTYEPAEQIANLEDVKQTLIARLKAMHTDLAAFALG